MCSSGQNKASRFLQGQKPRLFASPLNLDFRLHVQIAAIIRYLLAGLLLLQPLVLAQPPREIVEVSTAYNERTSISIGELFDDPSTFESRHVRIAGIVGDQDLRGNWLYIEDQAARIYVATPLALPRLDGKSVTINGTVSVRHGIPSIIARGVK